MKFPKHFPQRATKHPPVSERDKGAQRHCKKGESVRGEEEEPLFRSVPQGHLLVRQKVAYLLNLAYYIVLKVQ